MVSAVRFVKRQELGSGPWTTTACEYSVSPIGNTARGIGKLKDARPVLAVTARVGPVIMPAGSRRHEPNGGKIIGRIAAATWRKGNTISRPDADPGRTE